MNRLIICFIIVLLTLVSCNKEDNKTDLEKFLMKENIEVPMLNGEWDWLVTFGKNSSGGPTERTYSPGTEGYNMTVVFENGGRYKEYKDSALILDTHYRIESKDYNKEFDMYTYEIYYFEDKETQYLQVDLSGEEIRLNLFYDCIDCLDTYIYSKN